MGRLTRTYPVLSLVFIFAIWKLFLLGVTVGSPGVGYDTSTAIALRHLSPASSDHQSLSSVLSISQKLLRWDALYFIAIASRGYVFEQEWAFGWGFTRVLSYLDRANPGPLAISLVFVHASHLLSVLFLYYLSHIVFPHEGNGEFAFVSAVLHIISPAGLFLSAPYAESTFSALSFLGYLIYVVSLRNDQPVIRATAMIAAGASFGLATTLRSNGVLNGLLFLHDAVNALVGGFRDGRVGHALSELIIICSGGVLVALGLIVPQWIAYEEYCVAPSGQPTLEKRGWCGKRIPSVYSWVQSHYW
ncbi:MAG: ER membrane glycoprotein subunit of the GPI transamidase complex-like protein [Caeruleum heppii]|nr:MAG: ER membrane glycoprotein subunit of the GPI transamidase complex-like protein [Caeruleum heppii]